MVVATMLAAVACTGLSARAEPVAATDDARNTPRFLSLSIDSVAPSTITVTSDLLVAVVATVTNVGDRTVDNVTARVQRAPAVTTPGGLRSALQLDQDQFTIAGRFQQVADRLTPGQRKQFNLTIPLRTDPDLAAPAPSLKITQPGVFPLLVNVNGKPAYGKLARLSEARFLLPVLGVPADPNAADPQGPHGAAVGAPPAAAVATTILWPLADRPRRIAGKLGSVGEKLELTDDDLAASLTRGGRLDGLVGSLEFATSTNSDHDHKLADSVCLAVDPDLLITVSSMAKGYLVPATPGNISGPTKEGSGSAAATAWLARVRALASNLCVVALPFGQTDLRALAAVNNSALSATAISAPADVVDVLLSTRSQRGLAWPAAGAIDDAAGKLLRSNGMSSVILAADATHGPTADVVRLPDTRLRAVTYDMAAATALAAVGYNPTNPSTTPARLRFNLRGDSRPARLQNALGALSWAALNPQAPRTQLVAPPQLWEPSTGEADGILAQLATLLRSGLASPRKLTTLIGQDPDPTPARLDYPRQAADDAAPASVVDPIRLAAARIDEIAGALVDDPQKEMTPHQFLSPLQDDLLRALSLAGRPDAPIAVRTGLDNAAGDRVSRVSAAAGDVRRKVTVLSPGGLYTLASAKTPLLLVARNSLPVSIRVLIRSDAPEDMKISGIGEQLLPPNGFRTFQLPTQVSATRNLVVRFSLTTPAGQALGQPISVSVRSNAYGKALTIITECAGGLLLLLTGRRLWQRFRGRPHPADQGLEPGMRRRLISYGRARRNRVLNEPPTKQQRADSTPELVDRT